MSTLASSLIAVAKARAKDLLEVHWTESEWLQALNDTQRDICGIRPSAYSKISSMPLVAGTKQSIPSDGVLLLEVTRNMGVGGSTPGPTVRRVSRKLLEAQVPGWHSMTAVASIQHYVFDLALPKAFYVYPPASGATQVEVSYNATPEDVASVGSAITLDDVYKTILVDGMLFRAYSKDDEDLGMAERAMLYRKAFEAGLGHRSSSEAVSLAGR